MSEKEDAKRPLTPYEVHHVLRTAFELLMTIQGRIDRGVSPDTAYAIGVAVGNLSRAKALLGRDIDDREKMPDT